MKWCLFWKTSLSFAVCVSPWNVVDEDKFAVFPGKFVSEPNGVRVEVSLIRMKLLHVCFKLLEKK